MNQCPLFAVTVQDEGVTRDAFWAEINLLIIAFDFAATAGHFHQDSTPGRCDDSAPAGATPTFCCSFRTWLRVERYSVHVAAGNIPIAPVSARGTAPRGYEFDGRRAGRVLAPTTAGSSTAWGITKRYVVA